MNSRQPIKHATIYVQASFNTFHFNTDKQQTPLNFCLAKA